jgi:hypothetical protein
VCCRTDLLLRALHSLARTLLRHMVLAVQRRMVLVLVGMVL